MARTWIFQANPDRFDIDGFLATRPGETSWLVTRLGSQMKVGDEIFIWRAIGSGDSGDAGIIAQAEITGEVSARKDDPASAPFWKSAGDYDEVKDRALLRIVRAANKRETLQRSWFIEDPVLRELPILKMSNATNYSVEPVHASRIRSLWEKTGKDWTYADAVAGLWAYSQTFGNQVSKLPTSPVAEVSLKIGRSISGVYNKVMNFRSLDPRDQRKGLEGGSEVDRIVWAAFYDPPNDLLHDDAIKIEMARLWPDGEATIPVDEAETIDLAVDSDSRKLTSLSLKDLRTLYARGRNKRQPKPRARRSSTRTFDRDPVIIALAKVRAEFKCEVPDCDHTLFLDEDGLNFCEVHHIHPLAEGGADTPNNVACICPSHHREAHHGKDAGALRLSLTSIRKFTTQIITPAKCLPDEIKAFCAHVNSGEEVAELSPDRVLGHGLKLAFVRTGGTLAAVGALKRPDPDYHQRCFRKADVADQWSKYPIELGWIYCEEGYRGGMSYEIIDALMREPEGGQSWYATVRTDNPAMLHPLGKRDFEVVGTSYKSVEHPNAKIQLLVRAGGSPS